MSVFNTDEMDGKEAAFNAAEMDKQQLLSAGCLGTVSRNHGTPVHRSDFFQKMTLFFSRSSLAHLSVISGLRNSMFASAHSRGAHTP